MPADEFNRPVCESRGPCGDPPRPAFFSFIPRPAQTSDQITSGSSFGLSSDGPPEVQHGNEAAGKRSKKHTGTGQRDFNEKAT